MKKLAVLRTNTEGNRCPFGLIITHGCSKAGDLVKNMASLSILGDNPPDDELNDISDANRKLLEARSPNQRCIYATKLMPQKQVVECSYNEGLEEGAPEKVPFPAPFYAKNYNNTSLDGLNTVPIGYYADYDISRNLFYGITSINLDKSEIDGILKVAFDLAEKIKDGEI